MKPEKKTLWNSRNRLVAENSDKRYAKPPFVTVIIPTLNRAELLRISISSVLAQTFSDFEVIVIDNQSTDNTKNVVYSYHDRRIRYVLNNSSKGPGGARNVGISLARGEWIAFLDDDDAWLSVKLILLYQKIHKADQMTGLIYTGFAYYNFDKNQVISRRFPRKKGWIQNDLLCKNYIGTMSVVAIRSDVVKKVGTMDEYMYMFEDGEFYMRVAGAFKVDFINEILTYYRVSTTQKLSSNKENALDSYKYFLKKHQELINKSFRVRHKAASRIFISAVDLGSTKEIIKVLPWTLSGVLLDPLNFAGLMWTTISIIFSKIKSMLPTKWQQKPFCASKKGLK